MTFFIVICSNCFNSMLFMDWVTVPDMVIEEYQTTDVGVS